MTSPQSPTINLDQIINSDEWILLEPNEKIIEYIKEHLDPDAEWYAVAEVDEDNDYILIDRIHHTTVYEPVTMTVTTMSGNTIVPDPPIKIYLFVPHPPLPTKAGSKIYNVTVREFSEGNAFIGEYTFDSLTLDRNGTWFGLDHEGSLSLVDEGYDYLKITKFSLTPNKPNN